MFRTKLILYRDIIASHSLDTREEPHPHLWKCEFTFSGDPVRGRIVDFPALEKAVLESTRDLDGCYLNESPLLGESARSFPTCETLGESLYIIIRENVIPAFRSDNPTLRLLSVKVTLVEGERIYGSAITEFDQTS